MELPNPSHQNPYKGSRGSKMGQNPFFEIFGSFSQSARQTFGRVSRRAAARSPQREGEGSVRSSREITFSVNSSERLVSIANAVEEEVEGSHFTMELSRCGRVDIQTKLHIWPLS